MNVTFQHAGATLSGTVVLPPDGEVRAGLVFLHGSGPADSGHWSEWADVFVEHGVASLSYDKPGVGGSDGDWTRQSFADRASEALAAVRFLASDVLADGGLVSLSPDQRPAHASRIDFGSNTSSRATASPRMRSTLRYGCGTNVTRCSEAERTTVPCAMPSRRIATSCGHAISCSGIRT